MNIKPDYGNKPAQYHSLYLSSSAELNTHTAVNCSYSSSVNMKVFIKNMVCPRCIMAVEQVIGELGLSYSSIELGEVVLTSEPSHEQIILLDNKLRKLGFEMLDDIRTRAIERVKTFLVGIVQHGNIDEHFSLSEQISSHLNKEYSTISKLFSQVESITIEQFFILQKIEKVKEWLAYDEYSISEIAYKLGYSSVAHLSTQFKKVTGLTPSAFKAEHQGLRKPLDNLH